MRAPNVCLIGAVLPEAASNKLTVEVRVEELWRGGHQSYLQWRQNWQTAFANRAVLSMKSEVQLIREREQKEQEKLKPEHRLGLIKRHINTTSSLFLSIAGPAGSLSIWACSSRNWTAEYFPCLSPPSCCFPLSQQSRIPLQLCTEIWLVTDQCWLGVGGFSESTNYAFRSPVCGAEELTSSGIRRIRLSWLLIN